MLQFIPQTSLELDEIEEKRKLVDSMLAAGELGFLGIALAVNVLELADLVSKCAVDAVKRYADLLVEWNQHPEWQVDQPYGGASMGASKA